MDAMDIVKELKNLVDSLPSIESEDERDKVILTIRTIGRTAAFFGGYAGMTKLHNEYDRQGGDTTALNRLWDMVAGCWMA